VLFPPSCEEEEEGEDEEDEESSLKVLFLVEPNPLTHMSGQAARFKTLMKHLLTEKYHHNHENEIHLLTADRNRIAVAAAYDKADDNKADIVPFRPADVVATSFDDEKRLFVHYTWGVPLPQYPQVTLAIDFLALRLSRLCRQLRPVDILHVSSPGLLLFPAIYVSRRQGIPLVMSYHTHLPAYVQSYYGKYGWLSSFLQRITWTLLRFVHQFADVTLVTSPQIAQEFAKHSIATASNKLYTWPKGVDTTQFHPNATNVDMRNRMSSGHPHDLLLVYIGRLAKEKRLRDLKPILEELNDVHRIPTRLCLVGQGPEEAVLQAYFHGTPTTFLASLTGTALSQAFASGDVFVMPSDSETLGFVVLESMASGVPVVACRAGGLVDLIRDGETGFLVPVGDTAAFVDRIVHLTTTATSSISTLSSLSSLHNVSVSSFRPSTTPVYQRIARQARLDTEQWSWHASMEFVRRQVYPIAIQNCAARRWSFQRFLFRPRQWCWWRRKEL
jgi:sulfoquinovosyltransferase